RNSAPFFADVVRAAHASGHTRLLGLVTSAYTSYSGVGQYREDFEKALADTGLGAEVSIDRVREFFDHPGFVTPLSEGVAAAMATLAGEGIAPADTHILFVTHSIPNTAAEASGEGFE